MSLMFVAGAANFLAMLGLGAIMAAEKNARWGRRMAKPIGVALIVAGVAAAL
jgi:predicted metal-binding membrane protein